MNLFNKSKSVKSVKFAANPGIDNTRMYKFMTEETDMKLIKTDTANSIRFDELVYYLAMPDKNKINESKDALVVGNAKRLLRDVLMRFNTDPQGQLKTANDIINVLNASNEIIEDLSEDNIDEKIDKIINQSVPAVPELKTPSPQPEPNLGLAGQPDAGVALNQPPPQPKPEPDLGPDGQPPPQPEPYLGPGGQQDDQEEDEDLALEPGGQPGAANLGPPQDLPLLEPKIEQTDLNDPEFTRVLADIEEIKEDLAEKDTLLKEYDRDSNDMFAKLKKISNSDTDAVANDSNGFAAKHRLEAAKTADKATPSSQSLESKRTNLDDDTKICTMINIKQITEDFKNEIFNAKQVSIENYIQNISTKNTQIDGLLEQIDSASKLVKLQPIAKNLKTNIEKQIIKRENITKKITSIKIIRQELQGTIFTKSTGTDIMPDEYQITQTYWEKIIVYIFLKDIDLTYVQLPMTKLYQSKYKEYDDAIDSLLNRIIGKSNIGDLNSIKYNLYRKDDESIMRKFLDIEYKIVGYKNIIDNYNKNVQAEYAQDKKNDTRKRLCESIINYILNFFGPNYQNINNCFDFAGVEDEDDDKKWLKDCLYPDYMDIVFNKNPLPESNIYDGSKETAINIATAKAIDDIAEATAGDGTKYHFVEELPYTSLKVEDRYRLVPIQAAASDSQSDTIKYLFVALSNYPTHVPSEFEKLKWPFNRLIPMIQEITAELKRVGRKTDGPVGTADGEEGLGTIKLPGIVGFGPRVYKGGAKPVKKTFKKKSSKRKKTHKKLLNY